MLSYNMYKANNVLCDKYQTLFKEVLEIDSIRMTDFRIPDNDKNKIKYLTYNKQLEFLLLDKDNTIDRGINKVIDIIKLEEYVINWCYKNGYILTVTTYGLSIVTKNKNRLIHTISRKCVVGPISEYSISEMVFMAGVYILNKNYLFKIKNFIKDIVC